MGKFTYTAAFAVILGVVVQAVMRSAFGPHSIESYIFSVAGMIFCTCCLPWVINRVGFLLGAAVCSASLGIAPISLWHHVMSGENSVVTATIFAALWAGTFLFFLDIDLAFGSRDDWQPSSAARLIPLLIASAATFVANFMHGWWLLPLAGAGLAGVFAWHRLYEGPDWRDSLSYPDW